MVDYQSKRRWYEYLFVSLPFCERCAEIISGLLEKAGHPLPALLGIHGTLKTVRCTTCDYNFEVHKPDDILFLLSLSKFNEQSRPAVSDLPHCPKCTHLLRPGVVWFGERLAAGAPDNIDEWVSERYIDLVIAAGTSMRVFPAAEWVETARAYGATLAVFDTGEDHQLLEDLEDDDWYFQGDIAVILPRIVHVLERRRQAKE